MELLQLRYFYESAKNENFSKTASMFMVPTTSVSASIKRLEAELGCELFDRTANKIKLNHNGRVLQTALCSVFRDIDGAVEALSRPDEDKQPIKILIRAMRRKTTDLIIEYSRNNTDVSFKTVFNGEEDYESYDVIIDDSTHSYEGFDGIELFNMRLKLKCSSKSELLGKTLTLNELCKQPFVLMDIDSNMSKILERACLRAGFLPNIAVVCDDIECYEKFIASGMGIGIARSNENRELISDLNVMDFNEHYTVNAYYSKKKYFGKVKNFVEFLRSKS